MTGKILAAVSQPSGPDADGKWRLREIEEALRGLRFGTVTIVVQDGVVIQLERTEKRRFQRTGSKT
jgi:hypothetical protein